MRASQTRRLAVHVRTASARFGDQQNSRGHVPGIQSEFPEGIQAAASYIREIERGRTGAPDAMRDHRELIVEMYVHVLVPLAAGKTGGHQRVVDVAHI